MIIAGIATIPSRVEQVRKAIDSLLPQVDFVHVALNNFTAVPTSLMVTGAICTITQGSDEQKFKNVGGDIFLSCDDDLVYPKNYVKVIKQSFQDYDEIHNRGMLCGSTEIITFHGRSFNSFPIDSYYRSKSSRYRCLDKVVHDVPVHVGGTGCMAFRPANFKLSLADFPSKYMADIHVAIAAMKQNKRIMCIAHEAGWIKYQAGIKEHETIYERFKNDDAEQTERINQAFAVTV